MKKIVYMFGLLFFVNFTNTLHYNFAKLFSYKKIINGLGALGIVAHFYNPAIQKAKEYLLIKTIKSINVKKVELHKTVDAYNPNIYSVQENDSMKNAYLNLDKQVSNTLKKLQNNPEEQNIREYYNNIQATKKELDTLYKDTISCLTKSTTNPSVEEHNKCLNLWKNSNRSTKEKQ